MEPPFAKPSHWMTLEMCNLCFLITSIFQVHAHLYLHQCVRFFHIKNASLNSVIWFHSVAFISECFIDCHISIILLMMLWHFTAFGRAVLIYFCKLISI